MSNSGYPILVVEDSRDDFFFLQRSFKIAGIPNGLYHVEDGQQAIAYLQGSSPFLDRALILLDLKLPLKNGFEVLSWLRKQEPLEGVIVIVLSSSSEVSDVSKAYELGANAYLVKPTSIDKLTEIVRALDTFWLRHNKFLQLGAP
jgi:DNA-binding response OmpR family regulator